MLRSRKDQIFLYDRYAVGSKSEPPHVDTATSLRARLVVEEPFQPTSVGYKVGKEASFSDASELASAVVIESSKLVHGQQTLIQELVSHCKKLQAEIDFWKNKAEGFLTSRDHAGSAAQETARIEAIRKLLARELHPDAPNVPPAEAALRSSLFKTIWPKIDQITKGRVTN